MIVGLSRETCSQDAELQSELEVQRAISEHEALLTEEAISDVEGGARRKGQRPAPQQPPPQGAPPRRGGEEVAKEVAPSCSETGALRAPCSRL